MAGLSTGLLDYNLAHGFAAFYNLGSPDAITVTTAGTYYTYDGWTEQDTSQAVSFSSGVFTVNRTGKYMVHFDGSFSGSINAIVDARVFKNGSTGTNVALRRKLSAGGDVGNSGAGGILDLEAGDTVEVKFTSDSNGDTFSMFCANFMLVQVL